MTVIVIMAFLLWLCIQSSGETRHSLNLDFWVEFDQEDQHQSTPKTTGALHLWLKFDNERQYPKAKTGLG